MGAVLRLQAWPCHVAMAVSKTPDSAELHLLLLDTEAASASSRCRTDAGAWVEGGDGFYENDLVHHEWLKVQTTLSLLYSFLLTIHVEGSPRVLLQ